jgi:hypothetical protein
MELAMAFRLRKVTNTVTLRERNAVPAADPWGGAVWFGWQ